MGGFFFFFSICEGTKTKPAQTPPFFHQPLMRWTPRLASFNWQSPLACCTLPDRAARDSVSRAFKSEQSQRQGRNAASCRDPKSVPIRGKWSPLEGHSTVYFHFNINMWSVQMVNLSEGASSNGDIRAWIIYCAPASDSDLYQDLAAKEVSGTTLEASTTSARLPFWQTSQQHAVNTPLHPTARADASSTLCLRVCVCLCMQISQFS